jgi:hypothetical protein
VDWGRVRWENVGKLAALAAAGALLVWGWRDEEVQRPAAPERRRLPPPAQPVEPMEPVEPVAPAKPRRRRRAREPMPIPEPVSPVPRVAPDPPAPAELPPPAPRHGEFTPDPGP